MEEETCGLHSMNKLPDDVLRRIGSFLPLHEAVRTSILSWRWRNLWKPTQLNIHIDQTPFQDSSQLFTNNFLSSFHSPTSHNFCFLRDYSGEQPPENELTIMTMKANVLPLKHLKVVQMSGLAALAEEEEMMQLSLLDLFMEKAVILELMSITSQQIRSNTFNP